MAIQHEYFATEMKGLGCPRLKGTPISAEDSHLVFGLAHSVHPEVTLVLKDDNGKDVLNVYALGRKGGKEQHSWPRQD